MSDCPHMNFEVHAEVGRLTKSETDETVIAYCVDVKVCCRECQKPFEWVGLPCGFSHYQPTVSIDAQTLRAPLIPENGPQPPSGLPGFGVRFTSFPEKEPTKQ